MDVSHLWPVASSIQKQGDRKQTCQMLFLTSGLKDMMLFYFLTHIYKKKSKFDESLLLENVRLIQKEHFYSSVPSDSVFVVCCGSEVAAAAVLFSSSKIFAKSPLT